MAQKDFARFTLRIPQDLLDKFGYVAAYDDRSKNKELERMIKARITAFEEKHGPIELEKKD